jgi:uncharacterized membrane protein
MSSILRKQSKSLMTLAICLGFLALLQNPYGQFSDVRGFYGIHFSDGMHQWPYSDHQLMEQNYKRNPVEYPALTGLIMWIISFFVGDSNSAWQHYYWITAVLNSLLFGLASLVLLQFVAKKYVYFFMFSLAVIYSLHRNWDIWAVVPMLFSILYFEKERYFQSAVFLAIAIATKFFPIVLLLPISIFFFRRRQLRYLVKYFLTLIASWSLINLPFVVIDVSGWLYFYKFSYERGFGGGSIQEMIVKLGLDYQVSSPVFYIANLLIFSLVTAVMVRIKDTRTIITGSYLALFAFTFFNKQYSMQYIIWLTPFALMAINQLPKFKQKKVLFLFLIWQIFEFLFQYSFFQNILTNSSQNSEQLTLATTISDFEYGIVSFVRYIAYLSFSLILIQRNLRLVETRGAVKHR